MTRYQQTEREQSQRYVDPGQWRRPDQATRNLLRAKTESERLLASSSINRAPGVQASRALLRRALAECHGPDRIEMLRDARQLVWGAINAHEARARFEQRLEAQQ